MALLGAVTPAAFAQDVNQGQVAINSASNTANNNFGSVIVQDIDQGICQVQLGQGGAFNSNTAFQNFSEDCS